MSTEQLDFIMKQNEPSGSNYPSGYRQGSFFLPEESAQGVPIGMVHPFVCKNIPQIPGDPILSVDVTEAGSFFLKLGDITPVENAIRVVYPSNSSPYLELHIPRGLTIVTSDDSTVGNVIFSGEDQYQNLMVWEQNITDTVNNSGRIPKKLFSAYVTVDTFGDDATFGLNLTNTIELPYTDYGLGADVCPLILAAPVALQESLSAPIPNLVSVGSTSTYQFNFIFTGANWETPLTLGSGLPRPTINSDDWDGTDITILLINFGFENTKFIDEFISPIAEIYQGSELENEYYVFGLPQYMDSNFTTWQG